MIILKMPRNQALANLILVGCVKSKHSHTRTAKDLYNSPLWRCRRAYAERSGFPWYILSAKHGLLAPETKIAPYDLALADLPTSKCRAWSQGVLDDLIVKFPSLRGTVIDIHAGKRYVEFGLENGLSDAGAIIRRPLARVVGIGPQCAWYREHLTLDSLQ
jgi:hypothetical protein